MALKLTFPTRFNYTIRLDRVKVRLINSSEKRQWDDLMRKHHFLQSAHLAGNQLRYVAELYGKCVALLSFSAASYHLTLRDQWIGWSENQLFQRRHFVVQNSRLLILPEVGLQNLSSRVLSLCSKRLSNDWENHFGHPVFVVETFVDPAYHRGTCYKASNWVRLGETQGFSRSGRGFYESNGSPKALWVCPLRSDAQKLLSSKELPENFKRHEKSLSQEYRLAKIPSAPLGCLHDQLRTIQDHRSRKGRQFPLATCLAIVVCGTLAGCKGLSECAELAKSLNHAQRQALQTWYKWKKRRYEVPSHTTLWRVIAGTDPIEFERVVKNWFNQEKEELPEAICIDGKALRATLDENQKGHYIVSAIAQDSNNFFFSNYGSM